MHRRQYFRVKEITKGESNRNRIREGFQKEKEQNLNKLNQSDIYQNIYIVREKERVREKEKSQKRNERNIE